MIYLGIEQSANLESWAQILPHRTQIGIRASRMHHVVVIQEINQITQIMLRSEHKHVQLANLLE